jgi:hypothetical protein
MRLKVKSGKWKVQSAAGADFPLLTIHSRELLGAQ